MTTDLKSMTVEELAKYFGGIFDQACNSIVAFDELAGRLEEAQQTLSRFSDAMERDSEEIESLHRRLEEAQQHLELYAAEMSSAREAGFYSAQELWSAYQTAQQRNAAHDAKVAAEALEEARSECARVLGDTSEAVEIVDRLWAEYRAKATEAGRKE